MTAFSIEQVEIRNREAFRDYERGLLRTIRPYKGSVLAAGPGLQMLPGAILRKLGDAEKNAYRRPFLEAGESRRPTLTCPREIPIGGEPKGVHDIVSAYGDWLDSAPVPELLVNAEPGAMLRGALRERCRRWPNQTEVNVKDSHFVQEDSPDEIGQAIAAGLPKETA